MGTLVASLLGARLTAFRLGTPELDIELVNTTSIFGIKLVHTLVFWILSVCVLYALFSGITGDITIWTWLAVVLLFLEGVILAVSGWTCPLTILAERRGAVRGSVADIFLPKWFADRIFPICGSMYAIAIVLLIWQLASKVGV